jgi:hypothetical protein
MSIIFKVGCVHPVACTSNFTAASPGFIKQVHNPNGFKRVTHSRDGDFGTFFSFRNENDVTYKVDAFVHVVLGKV